MSLLSRNLAAFAAGFPDLAATMADTEPASEFEVSRAADGRPTAAAGGIMLHSRYHPRTEADRAALQAADCDLAVFLGFALGYQIEACLDRFPAMRILVVEADPRFLRSAMEERDLTRIAAAKNVDFMVGAEPDSVLSYLNRVMPEKIVSIPIRPLLELRREYYASVLASIGIYRSKREINENTLRRFGRLWVRNLFRNAFKMARSPGIEAFAGAFTGIPALILAAGPSLDEVLPQLGDLSRRCLIVSVDTALRSALRSSIEPDFTVIVDPQYWNARHLDGLRSPGSILITEPAAYPSVFAFPCRAVLTSGSLYPLGGRLEEASVGKRVGLGAGGSVATSAWDFARFAGCAPIFLAGLDLGYPGFKTHATGSYFEERAHALSSRLIPYETPSFLSLHEAGSFPIPAVRGGTVTTDRRMIVYKWWFESKMKEYSEVRSYNLSAGSAIAGMPAENAESLIRLSERREEIDEKLSGTLQRAVLASGADAAERRLASALEALAISLERMESSARRALSITDGLLAGDPAESKQAFALLDGIDAELTANGAKDIASFLVPPASAMAGAEASTMEEALRNGRRIYAEIAEAAAFHSSSLKKAQAFGGNAEN